MKSISHHSKTQKVKYKATLFDYKMLNFMIMGAPENNSI